MLAFSEKGISYVNFWIHRVETIPENGVLTNTDESDKVYKEEFQSWMKKRL
jgi:hypothetical protein